MLNLSLLKILGVRLHQGHRTLDFPGSTPTLSDRFRGRPEFKDTPCPTGCSLCTEGCPTGAISRHENGCGIDLGSCIFCGACAEGCPQSRIAFTQDYRLATRDREDLVLKGQELKLAQQLEERMRKLFGRSLKLRQVSAGGCNACEADVNVLGTVTYDMARFGLQFVASPRHADGILVTGPVSENMKSALLETYQAVADPKVVIAVGACAISGGIYQQHPETNEGLSALLPVDLYIPGCPPHPLTTLDGLLRLMGQLEEERRN